MRKDNVIKFKDKNRKQENPKEICKEQKHFPKFGH